MKLIFAGTPVFSVKSLEAIFRAGYEIDAVLTMPDKPQGRKQTLLPSPVKEAALRLGLPVLQPVRLREELSALADRGADLMVTCAYGQILTREVLELFPLGVWNVHASLLPAYRGAAPIARAILDGCSETGITIMKTDVGLDTGDIFLQERIPILRSDTCGSLSERLSASGAKLIVEALGKISRGEEILRAQGEGTKCGKVVRTAVDFSRSAREVSALIRALSPAPLAYAVCDGREYNLFFAEETEGSGACGEILAASRREGGLIVACGEGAVQITELQPAGGKRMSAADFLNGNKLQKGMRFDQPVL